MPRPPGHLFVEYAGLLWGQFCFGMRQDSGPVTVQAVLKEYQRIQEEARAVEDVKGIQAQASQLTSLGEGRTFTLELLNALNEVLPKGNDALPDLYAKEPELWKTPVLQQQERFKNELAQGQFNEKKTWILDLKIEEKTEHTAQRGHHTAIVNGKLDSNGGVKTLEQHVKPKGDVVQNMYLYTRDVPAVATKSVGQYKHPGTRQLERVNITKTVTITVKGTIWPYRPKPK